MSNDISNFIPELWSNRIQKLREKMLIAKAICSFEEQAGLSFGDRVHRPTAPDFTVNDYVRNTDVTLQDVSTGDEYMDINRSKEVSFYVDLLDKKQSKYDVEMEAVKRATYVIKNEMDGAVLAEVVNAGYTIDAAQNGGSAGTPSTLVPSTAVQFFENAKAVLRTNNVEDDRAWFLVTTPKIISTIAQTFVGSGFNLADSALKNGYKGDAFGLKVYESTNVMHTQVFTASTLVNTNTFAVAGVTFTLLDTLGSTAGNVHLGTTDETALTNLALAINGGAVGSEYIALTAANRAKIKAAGITATSTATTITITGVGSFTATGTAVTLVGGSLVSHSILGRMGCIDMVVQLEPQVQKNKDPKKTGYNWIIVDLYGKKTFAEGAVRMADVQVIA